MINSFTSTINAINRDSDKFRIVTFSVHEGFQTEMAKTGHEFVHIESPEKKEWDKDYREMPSNVMEVTRTQFFETDKVDLIISHTLPQKEFACHFSRDFNVPHICLMHCYPNEKWTNNAIAKVKNDLVADYNVFTTKDQAESWGYSVEDDNVFIINHAIDTDIFNVEDKQNKGYILTVGNYYRERSAELGFDRYAEIKNAIGGKINFVHVGKSEDGFSKPAKDINDLAQSYKNAGVFLNTCHRSVLPTTLLEAMACGCPVISYPNPTIAEILNNNENGIMVNSIQEALEAIRFLYTNKEAYEKISANCVKLIQNEYSVEKHIQNWNKLFEEAIIK